MTCCAPATGTGLPPAEVGAAEAGELLLASRTLDNGLLETQLSVPAAHCGACISAIESALMRLDQVEMARVNLTTRRVAVRWRRTDRVPPFLSTLQHIGYEACLLSQDTQSDDPESGRLVRSTAVAGFAAMNIMLLSVSVWAGADDTTRQAFHLISALIALPAIAYSGRVFYTSAWSALVAGRTNMDVPISVGILLALGLSLYDTLNNGPHAYFDAVTGLIFFLLLGRLLDHIMRRKGRSAVLGLQRMMPSGATVIEADGRRLFTPVDELKTGHCIEIKPGERVPLDGVVVSGSGELDASLVTGEALPVPVEPGSLVLSGMLDLDGQLVVRTTQAASTSFLSEMIRMMEAAEFARPRYRQLADRAAALYSPVIHSLAALTFLGWFITTGDPHQSVTVAIAVLIITCPCALGLAVPMVQALAARRMLESGIALRDGSALERLCKVDTVIFDKTGTLTTGKLRMTKCSVIGADLAVAAALAKRSHHPVSRTIATIGEVGGLAEVEDFAEIPGMGLQGKVGSVLYRLGRPGWSGSASSSSVLPNPNGQIVIFSRNGSAAGAFEFADELRPRAQEAVRLLADAGLRLELLSGDHPGSVAKIAKSVGIETWHADLVPGDKLSRLEQLRIQGSKTLMVGDGLNDVPALAAAHVSIAPATAADVGRSSADMVFLRRDLLCVPEAISIARRSDALIRQNIAFAVAYNICVIPLAIAGQVTPLVAAASMSLSSIMVVANALRILPVQKDNQKTVHSHDLKHAGEPVVAG